MARSPHPKKEVEEALRHAEGQGWRVEVGGSHAWGRIYCPYNDEECRCGEFCITSVRIPLMADSDSIPIADSVPGDGGHVARVS